MWQSGFDKTSKFLYLSVANDSVITYHVIVVHLLDFHALVLRRMFSFWLVYIKLYYSTSVTTMRSISKHVCTILFRDISMLTVT